ncbi:dihydropteroate synthase [Halovenus sp. WSH3]|uniref:Probable bifunctional folylpolyglutamate synthase/dihydropteroate synthase n=1 Tax=Halovenus carboxidivorans TaxID=2692199 RepID=A0A6B0T7F7_9EURY|nr:dihydropteroate synthase [Halovenus carboxidivorans]MXR51523.1 dihydropteroate synthase [Halovenus carboxidivorans]
MRFHQAANYLLDLRRFGSRPGTDATRELLDALGNPHDGLACVQIAGSNGKGSTARMVESILRTAGLDVGLYTSPHLDDIRERVRINGRKLAERSLVEFADEIGEHVTDRAVAGDAPTFFETVTALALWEFGRQDVDVAILEVGIGGTHDATSVVDPIATAITSVTLEHTDILGNDVETIATDMAGIASDGPLVTAASGDALGAIRETVSDPVVVGEEGTVTARYEGRDGLEGAVTVDGPDWGVETKLPLLGSHQARNAGVAATLARRIVETDAVDDLAPPPELTDEQSGLSEPVLARGLRNAHWPGRFEVMDQEPLTVLDGAHNPNGCECVAETLGEFEYENLHLVVGVMADKDHRGIACAFDPDTVTCCEPDLDRAEDDDVLARVFETETEATVRTRADVAGAVDDALADAGEDDCVLVTGSLYTVAEARALWARAKIPKRVDSIPEAKAMLRDANVTDAGSWRMRGKAVHRIIKTRVQPRQAQYLKEELLSLGGECAISGLNDQDRENLDVVMMGTMAQFRRLAEKLDGQPYGLAPFADELRETLDIGAEPTTDGYPWEDGTAVMGILNVTPDSFHDGGEYEAQSDALERAEEMIEAGADIIDVGGESTRPGADPVPVEEEKARVLPIVERINDLDALVSVDTRKAEVARAALDAGADILNDVSGLEDPEMRLVAAEYDVPVVVMHSINAPVDPDSDIHYDDVVEDVIDSLTERILLAEKAGLDRSQIIIDPGLGFGKSSAESFELLGRIGEFRGLGCPILVGHSHKSMFELVDRGSGERYDPTVAATALAAERGADIVRVHDVAPNRAAVDVVDAADDPFDRE